MNSGIQVGSILIEDRPATVRSLCVEIDSYAGNWSLVRSLNGRDLERKIRAVGWNFFFMAEEVKASFWGAPSSTRIRSALIRIVKRKRAQCFNCLEVTAIIPKHFLGVPYTMVSAHCRHVQPSWQLDDIQRRRTEQKQAEWARG